MTNDIKALLGTDRLLLGTERTMKALRNGNLEKVFLASNVNPVVEDDINHYKSMSDFEIVKMKETNEELGVVCKKSFSVSVIGVLKQK